MIWNQGGSQMLLYYYYIFDICIGQLTKMSQKKHEMAARFASYTVNFFYLPFFFCNTIV